VDIGGNMKVIKRRTERQSRSLHLMFEHLAQELNDAGLDMKKTLKPEVDIPWDKQTIKDYLWRPIQEAMLKKESTTEITTKEIDRVMNVLTRHLANRFSIEIQFPSVETLMMRERTK